MAKPTDKPLWGTDTNYPAGPNPWNATPTKVEPAGAKQEAGFEPKEKPPAQYLNWLFNLIYQWILYLWDGLSDDVVTEYELADGSNDDVDISGVGSLVGLTNFHVTYNIAVAGPSVLTGIAGGYPGKEIVITAVDGSDPFYLEYESAGSDPNNRIYGRESGGVAIPELVVIPPSGSLTLRYFLVSLPGGGTGRWYVVGSANCYPVRTVWAFPAGLAQVTGGIDPPAYNQAGYVSVPSGTSAITRAMDVPVGTRITGAKARVKGPGGSSGLFVNVELFVARGATTLYLGGVSYEDTADAAWHTETAVNDPVMPYTLADGESLFWKVDSQYNNLRISGVALIVEPADI